MPFRWRKKRAPRSEPTAEQREAFDELLLGEDLEAAEMAAFEYALSLTGKNEAMATQLVKSARTLMWERASWDPDQCTLQAYLVGVVRTEWSNESRRARKERENEVEYLTEVATLDGPDARSPEQLAMEEEERLENRDAAAAELEVFRQHFVDTRDEVNLKWIQFCLEGIEDPAKMAEATGWDVKEFYRARDRRVRYVERLLRDKRGEDDDDEE